MLDRVAVAFDIQTLIFCTSLHTFIKTLGNKRKNKLIFDSITNPIRSYS